jgi:hypothetical protein
VLRLKSVSGLPSAAPVYLLDLSGLPHAPVSLELEMDTGGEFFNTGVSLHFSADLARWSEYPRRQIIAYYGDSGASRNTLELSGENARYILLKFDKRDIAPKSVTAHFKALEIPPPSREKSVAAQAAAEDKKSVAYNTGGFYPLTALAFSLPEADSIEVNIRNRFNAEEDWRFIARKTLFRLNSGTGAEQGGGSVMRNEALEINSAAPFWELESSGGRAFASIPECTAQWAVYELVFLGRGSGPWTLAYGNRDCGPAKDTLPLEEFSAGSAGGSPEIEDAVFTGKARYQGKTLNRRKPDREWGQFVLWGVLILAAIVLSSLAFYIARSMGKETKGT